MYLAVLGSAPAERSVDHGQMRSTPLHVCVSRASVPLVERSFLARVLRILIFPTLIAHAALASVFFMPTSSISRATSYS